MARKVKKHRNQVSDLVKNMDPHIDVNTVSEDRLMDLIIAINEQAVKDAEKVLKEMRTKPANKLLQLQLREVMEDDLIPFFCNNYVNISGKEMMRRIIDGRMRKDRLKEMPDCWQDVLDMTSLIETGINNGSYIV